MVMWWKSNEEKNYVVKRHIVSVGGFSTQLEAYSLADEIQKEYCLPGELISINESDLLLSQSEHDTYLDKVKESKSKNQQL